MTSTDTTFKQCCFFVFLTEESLVRSFYFLLGKLHKNNLADSFPMVDQLGARTKAGSPFFFLMSPGVVKIYGVVQRVLQLPVRSCA